MSFTIIQLLHDELVMRLLRRAHFQISSSLRWIVKQIVLKCTALCKHLEPPLFDLHLWSWATILLSNGCFLQPSPYTWAVSDQILVLLHHKALNYESIQAQKKALNSKKETVYTEQQLNKDYILYGIFRHFITSSLSLRSIMCSVSLAEPTTWYRTCEMHLDLQLIQHTLIKMVLMKAGCQAAILKEGKQEEKAELCQMTQEVDWKSVTAGLMERWILPRSQHYWSSPGSSWQRTEQKAADIQRRALKCPSRSPENYSWRLLKDMTRKLV